MPKPSPLPPDLARPRNPERTRLIATLAIASSLLSLDFALIAWAIVT